MLQLSVDLNFTANLMSRYFVPSQKGITSKKQTRKILRMNMKPMILNQEQQISFISMCNNAVNKAHKEEIVTNLLNKSLKESL